MPQATHPTEKEAREAWRTAPLEDLVLHIVERYHMATRLELARLEALAEEAALLHGQAQPALIVLRDEVVRLGSEMRAHLVFEERTAFPAILAQARDEGAALPAELLAPMKQIIVAEHEAEAGHIRTLRNLLEPLPAFEDLRGLGAKLHTAYRILAEDLQQHLFLENQILIPRAF